MAALEHHRVPGAGVTLHAVTSGSAEAPPLILLHGWPDSWRCWEAIIPLLADRYRLVVPDQRGFGESDMPEGTSSYGMGLLVADLVGVMNHFEIRRAGVVGHDFGGAVTWAAAALTPDRLTRAVVLASPHPMRFRTAALENPRQLVSSFYVWLMHAGERGEALLAAGRFRRLAAWAFAGSKVPAEVIEEHLRRWSEPGRFHAMAEWYRANYPPELFNPDVPLDLPAGTIPVRYVHAARDAAFVPEAATGSGAYVQADYDEFLIADATHWLPWDVPGRVADLVADWMNRD
jgi:pimeloyl-ACP methyl ester carboxylesterase